MTKHWLISARVIYRQKVDPKTSKPVCDSYGDEIPAEEQNLGPQMVVADSLEEGIVAYDKETTAEYRRKDNIDRVEHFALEMNGPFRVEEQATQVKPVSSK